MRTETDTTWQIMAATSLAVLWGLGLFGVLEADILGAKLLIVSALAPLSLGIEQFFYG